MSQTIQSISLLAYLAEHHNLWGPFLVISPSSTLHNWQQELARFVPKLKALPYWGSPKDRETLRRIWSRKNMTFNEDSPFHILVTSYQLVSLDPVVFSRNLPASGKNWTLEVQSDKLTDEDRPSKMRSISKG